MLAIGSDAGLYGETIATRDSRRSSYETPRVWVYASHPKVRTVLTRRRLIQVIQQTSIWQPADPPNTQTWLRQNNFLYTFLQIQDLNPGFITTGTTLAFQIRNPAPIGRPNRREKPPLRKRNQPVRIGPICSHQPDFLPRLRETCSFEKYN